MIDAFAHFYPPAYMRRVQALCKPLPVFVNDAPSHVDAAFRITELDRLQIDAQVVALGTPSFDELFAPEQGKEASELARLGNDGIADLVARYPRRFIGAATLPLCGPGALAMAPAELERVVTELDFKAVQIYTRVGDTPLDDSRFDALWKQIAAYDIPILLHPTGGFDHRFAGDYMLWLTFGWPLETSLVMTRLVYAGLFARFPGLKILTHHLGAFIPFMAARIQGVHYTLERTQGVKLETPLLESLRGFYGDTAVNGFQPALNAGYEFFGADHILFGTDYPFVPLASQCDAVLRWELPADDKAKILDANARKLFRM